MCGIFGVALRSNSVFSRAMTERVMRQLFQLSESRGKEAAGIALNAADGIYLAKFALPASKILDRPEFRKMFDYAFPANGHANLATCIIGHSRLVTNGGHQIHANNQPIATNEIVAIHNGIITNVDQLWAEFPTLQRRTDLDTEVLLSLLRHTYQKTGDLVGAFQTVFDMIEGVASMAALFGDFNALALATNNGSLYLGRNSDSSAYVFASEQHILDTLFTDSRLRAIAPTFTIQHVQPGSGLLIDLETLTAHEFSLAANGKGASPALKTLTGPKTITDVSPAEAKQHVPERVPGEGPYVLSPSFVDEYPRNRDAIAGLRRCTRCVLPETMPFITFDEEGVCNYCRTYQPIEFRGIDQLRAVLAPYRSQNGEPDCLITFSGGRDSSYTVHLLKTELGMNPITYTYDWGMVTDLARRNQMRLCGKLGLEHILVSADINKKRRNIRKNVLAWLRKPDLGTVPLFMAGDKQYFYHANRLARQNKIDIIILGENLLETTRFKTGFCGIPPQQTTEHTYTLSFFSKMRLAWYYGTRTLTNPAYLNASLLDTIGAYISYYFIPHNYVNVYQYVRWDENEITTTLIDEYNWEVATDTSTTWRIGDGTAAFYNYIYYTVAGFSENDTFRSNQIREGMLTRDEALQHIDAENTPRYESIQWYCDVIGIDFERTIATINRAPKRYPMA